MDTSTHTIDGMTASDARGAFGALLQRHSGIVFKIAGSHAYGAEDRVFPHRRRRRP